MSRAGSSNMDERLASCARRLQFLGRAVDSVADARGHLRELEVVPAAFVLARRRRAGSGRGRPDASPTAPGTRGPGRAAALPLRQGLRRALRRGGGACGPSPTRTSRRTRSPSSPWTRDRGTRTSFPLSGAGATDSGTPRLRTRRPGAWGRGLRRWRATREQDRLSCACDGGERAGAPSGRAREDAARVEENGGRPTQIDTPSHPPDLWCRRRKRNGFFVGGSASTAPRGASGGPRRVPRAVRDLLGTRVALA